MNHGSMAAAAAAMAADVAAAAGPATAATATATSPAATATADKGSDKKTAHPPWAMPVGAPGDLRVSNSLTSTRVPFVTIKPREVKAYICGPTVYDSAHLGHARAYITFDIIRRILSDYFGYHVFWTMNITDIDDKIILRARRDFLVDRYARSVKSIEQLVKDIRAAFVVTRDKHTAKLKELKEKVGKVPKSMIDTLKEETQQEQLKADNTKNDDESFEKAVKAGGGDSKSAAGAEADFAGRVAALMKFGRSVLATALDKTEGASVSDHAIFQAHARRYEKEFLEDMQALGVRDPDGLTRVSEYVPQIVEYIKGIEKAGIAYAAGGSVYFSVAAFKAKGHAYAKLAPWQVGNESAAAEGEGELSAGTGSEKKSGDDFALWKKSKPGEPAWPSPWGNGRPGWHIECSAMASDLLGKSFDIHAGGEDLKFPHHDNELAQSEAHSGCQQWVNYFMHAGHLNIKGLKMSKSLKNFITIRDVLREHSARHIRLLFLLQSWDGKMNYSDGSLTEAAAKQNILKEFFLNVKSNIRARGGAGAAGANSVDQLWKGADRVYHDRIVATQNGVHSALSDNFDYPKAMEHLLALVGDTNRYVEAKESKDSYKPLLLQKAAQYVHRILKVFGVLGESEATFDAGSFSAVGGAFGADGKMAAAGSGSGSGSGGGASSAANDKQIADLLDVLSNFRDAVRKSARANEPAAALLKLADELRDGVLPRLGVRLEDKPDGQPSVWKMESAAELMRQLDEKKNAAKAKAVAKLRNQLADRKKELDKYATASKDGKALLAASGLYSKFGADGMPTHAAGGEELKKNALKDVLKTVQKNDRLHTEYKEKLAKEPNFYTALQATITKMEAEIAALEAQS